MVQQIAGKLNLAKHWVGFGDKKRQIYGPTDIEGHRGRDGRYYLVDFARLFPPEPKRHADEPAKRGRHLYGAVGSRSRDALSLCLPQQRCCDPSWCAHTTDH